MNALEFYGTLVWKLDDVERHHKNWSFLIVVWKIVKSDLERVFYIQRVWQYSEITNVGLTHRAVRNNRITSVIPYCQPFGKKHLLSVHRENSRGDENFTLIRTRKYWTDLSRNEASVNKNHRLIVVTVAVFIVWKFYNRPSITLYFTHCSTSFTNQLSYCPPWHPYGCLQSDIVISCKAFHFHFLIDEEARLRTHTNYKCSTDYCIELSRMYRSIQFDYQLLLYFAIKPDFRCRANIYIYIYTISISCSDTLSAN